MVTWFLHDRHGFLCNFLQIVTYKWRRSVHVWAGSDVNVLLDDRQESEHKSSKDPASCHTTRAAAQAPSFGTEAPTSDEETRGSRWVPEVAGAAFERGKRAQAGAPTYRITLQVEYHTHRLDIVGRKEIKLHSWMLDSSVHDCHAIAYMHFTTMCGIYIINSVL